MQKELISPQASVMICASTDYRAKGSRSATTYSVLQRCSNVVPSSAGDDWDIFTAGESGRG